MRIIVNKMVSKRFARGVLRKNNRYMYWVNLFGLGIMITNYKEA